MADDDEGIEGHHLEAIADADPYPYWYDDADEPDSNPTLVRTETCDLCVVGGGYTGLWTAIIAKERDPSRDIVLIDAHEIGSAASGRNGGFMESSLTHGVANGQQRFPQELPLLEVDPDHIKRAILNLVDNAVEAVGGAGTVTVETEYVAESGRVRLIVGDNGPGIPSEDRDRLFLPYVSTKVAGMGLGLPIVSEIVNEHGGVIRVEDNQPSGCRFIVEMPVSRTPAAVEA